MFSFSTSMAAEAGTSTAAENKDGRVGRRFEAGTSTAAENKDGRVGRRFATWEFSNSFEIALRSELQRIFSETETCRKTSVQTIMYRLIEQVLDHLKFSVDDLRELIRPENAFVHPQVFEKFHSIFAQRKNVLDRNEYAGKLLDRVSASDYNDPADVRELVSALENLADTLGERAKVLKDHEVSLEIYATLASDGLGDCSRHLRYPLKTETSVKARPIGSDYDAMRVHVMAVRKMYHDLGLGCSREEFKNAILEAHEIHQITAAGKDPETDDPPSHLAYIYFQSVGSFMDQVWKEVVKPKLDANRDREISEKSEQKRM